MVWCNYHNQVWDICKAEHKDTMEKMSQTANSGKGDIPANLVNIETALKDFYLEIEKVVSKKAKEKGYYVEGEDSGRNLYDFIGKYASGHGIGEIIYKAIRWTRKRDPEDLIKIAAWAFLEWDHNRRQVNLYIPKEYIEKLKELTEDHSSESIPCRHCHYVKSAHIKDTLMNRLICPIQPHDKASGIPQLYWEIS